MRKRDLYSKILDRSAPWHVTHLFVGMPAWTLKRCLSTEVTRAARGVAGAVRVTAPEAWLVHRDICLLKTYLVALTPGPWAETGRRFAALPESLVIA